MFQDSSIVLCSCMVCIHIIHVYIIYNCIFIHIIYVIYPLHFTRKRSNQVEFSPPFADRGARGLNLRPAAPQDMELKANETDKLIKGMQLKPTDDSIKYDWNTEA